VKLTLMNVSRHHANTMPRAGRGRIRTVLTSVTLRRQALTAYVYLVSMVSEAVSLCLS